MNQAHLVFFAFGFIIILYSSLLIIVSVLRLNSEIKRIRALSPAVSKASKSVEVNLFATVVHVIMLVILMILEISNAVQ